MSVRQFFFQLTAPSKLPGTAQEVGQTKVDKMDANDDGTVDAKELKKFKVGHGSLCSLPWLSPV